MKPYLRFLLGLLVLLLLLAACRSRRVEVAAVPRNRPAAKPRYAPPSKPAAPRTHADSSEEWYRALGLSRKEMKESKLYSFIGEWYGTPYKYGGCMKAGVDCSCFAGLLNENVYNRRLPRTAHDMFLQSEQIGIGQARQGDLVFFRMGGRKITHVGVYLGNGRFVHSSTSSGVSVNSLDEAYYKSSFYCAGRIRE